MEIRAYDEEYLPLAQRVLGDMFDFAVGTLGVESKWFSALFITSYVSKQVEAGNPAYIAGRTGCELAKLVIRTSGLDAADIPDEMYVDKTPEYWAGWMLAYCQWRTNRTFSEILSAIPFDEIAGMYEPYHEMDVESAALELDKIMAERSPETHLGIYRKRLGLSQSELSRNSGVPLRQIQLFEQRQRDINSTKASCLLKLSKALYCEMECLME